MTTPVRSNPIRPGQSSGSRRGYPGLQAGEETPLHLPGNEGFRITGRRGRQWDVRRLSRKTGQVWVPKAGWVRFRRSRAVPPDAKSYRVTRDRADRWHVAFAVIPAIARLRARQKAGLNRGIPGSGWGLLVRRLAGKAPGRVEKVSPAFTSQRCPACGQVDRDSRESQARFVCTAWGFAGHADVNAAINIAAGHAVTARGGDGVTRPVNREPHLLLPSA
jgi:transposase